MKKLILVAAGIAAVAASTALARPGGGQRGPDANGDGVVTRAEVEADVAKRFQRMDVNKDGKLNAADREAAKKEREERRGAMFARVDSNGDGAVSPEEMKRAALMRFDRADADKDGKLTGAERESMRPKRGEGGRQPQG